MAEVNSADHSHGQRQNSPQPVPGPARTSKALTWPDDIFGKRRVAAWFSI
jgi:hypothetical protein